MSIEIKVPSVGESITEVTVARWMKAQGERVGLNESIAALETDKVTLEVPAPVAGILSKIVVPEGQTAPIGAVLGVLTSTGDAGKPDVSKSDADKSADLSGTLPADSRAAGMPTGLPLTPAVRKLVEENRLEPAAIEASGKEGRLTKEDVIRHMDAGRVALSSPTSPASRSSVSDSSGLESRTATHVSERQEERVPFTRLRLRIAERLKQAQNTAAILTTFNEVDMSELMALRERYRGQFEKTYGVRLGLVSLFVKASVSALRKFPVVNAAIDEREIVYKNYYDIGVAVGTDRGLVVPVLRDADRMSLADIERGIADFGKKAREGRLTLGELSGGTFTISNGGVYGSLLSTPIPNPPQSGILGLHKIQDRPVAVSGKVEIRKMMFIALSYDHRIIDGREAVSFLVHVKECVEEPQRMLLGL